MFRVLICSIFIFSSCNSTTYYIVRHAEKEQGTAMTSSTTKTSDVPLSAAGNKRAQALKKILSNKRINTIYATNTLRAQATAKPLSEASGIVIKYYNAVDSSFLRDIKNGKGNTLIVGHSNTVDDIINHFFNVPMLSDLADSAYGDLFIIKKEGNKFLYTKRHFGK